jgi:hypothetical protein
MDSAVAPAYELARRQGQAHGGWHLRFGLGGLTVLDAVIGRLPEVPFVYYGDNAHMRLMACATPTTSSR